MARVGWTEVACAGCGATYRARPYKVRDGQRCCSRRCARALQEREKLASLPEIFWAQVDRRGPDECWEFTGPKIGKPPVHYGRAHIAGRAFVAHRLAYELTHGPLPPELFACHRCDNPPCCNPAHLFAGTHADNMRDMWAKGRRQ